MGAQSDEIIATAILLLRKSLLYDAKWAVSRAFIQVHLRLPTSGERSRLEQAFFLAIVEAIRSEKLGEVSEQQLRQDERDFLDELLYQAQRPCYKCGNLIVLAEAQYCHNCGGYKCHGCHSCFCNAMPRAKTFSRDHLAPPDVASRRPEEDLEF